MFYKNPKILVIEDNPDNLEHVSSILIKARFQLDIAVNGLYAMTRLASNNYDLVILDLSKPGINGKDFISMIKASSLTEALPVIFIIPSGAKKDFISGMDVGGYDFVGMPITEKELLTRINLLLELKNARQQIKKSESFKSSLRYASQIQASLLPSSRLLDDQFSSYFLLSLPLDIVSGDFFWIKRIGKHLYVAVADATGHGVPGAFLSVLGISLLNEITLESTGKEPGDILNELRDKVKNSLRSNHLNAEQYNGLDMAICKIDTETDTITFAGANSSAYIAQGEEFIELKGDRQPIGSHITERPFENQYLQAQSGDRIYFSSDGFADQLGGGKHPKKYQRRNFKTLLENISHKQLSNQKEILLEKHMEWRGEQDQVDDILVLGLELPVS